jgi:hypothetical protein
MLLELSYKKDEFIFMEGEGINFIYFLHKGEVGFVLPRYDNAIYVLVT